MASKQVIAEISGWLAAGLGTPIPEANLYIWHKILQPLSDDLVRAATMRVLQTEQKTFLPAPGAVYQAARDIMSEKLPSREEAWYLARAWVRGDAKLDKLPLCVQTAVNAIGKQAFRNMKSDDNILRAHFFHAYEAEQGRELQHALSSGDQLDALEGGQDVLD